MIPHNIVALYLDEGEQVQLAFSAYTGNGFGRRVVGVTTKRFILIKSRYVLVRDGGLLWAEPLGSVALKGIYLRWHANGVYNGNSYVTVRRGDGRVVALNPRSSFWGGRGAADGTIEALYSKIAGRF